MTDHPITPPPELAASWVSEIYGNDPIVPLSPITLRLVERAAQWGADQELEACCEWLENVDCDDPQETAKELRAARRPKPPSLKEQALKALKHAPGPDYPNPITLLTADEHALIRRALEALPND
jgi:hypothetical protein